MTQNNYCPHYWNILPIEPGFRSLIATVKYLCRSTADASRTTHQKTLTSDTLIKECAEVRLQVSAPGFLWFQVKGEGSADDPILGFTFRATISLTEEKHGMTSIYYL